MENATRILGGLGALNMLAVLLLSIRSLVVSGGSESQKVGKGLCIFLGAFCVFWIANILGYDKSVADVFSAPIPSSLALVALIGIAPAIGFYAFFWTVHRFVIGKRFNVIGQALCIAILSSFVAVVAPRFYTFFAGGESAGRSVGAFAMLGVLGGGFLYVIKMLLVDEIL